MERFVEHHRSVLKLAYNSCSEVVGGRAKPAAGDDQRTALGGEPAQRGENVGGTVTNHNRALMVDAERAQLLGAPRAVAVDHAAGQYLGPSYDDAGALAHSDEPGRVHVSATDA